MLQRITTKESQHHPVPCAAPASRGCLASRSSLRQAPDFQMNKIGPTPVEPIPLLYDGGTVTKKEAGTQGEKEEKCGDGRGSCKTSRSGVPPRSDEVSRRVYSLTSLRSQNPEVRRRGTENPAVGVSDLPISRSLTYLSRSLQHTCLSIPKIATLASRHSPSLPLLCALSWLTLPFPASTPRPLRAFAPLRETSPPRIHAKRSWATPAWPR